MLIQNEPSILYTQGIPFSTSDEYDKFSKLIGSLSPKVAFVQFATSWPGVHTKLLGQLCTPGLPKLHSLECMSETLKFTCQHMNNGIDGHAYPICSENCPRDRNIFRKIRIQVVPTATLALT